MTLPSNGPLSLPQIQSEFGGTSPISLSEYYRGGPYTTTNNTGVPTSGPISISDFYGTTGEIVSYITSNRTNVDVRDYFGGVWYQSTPKRLIINSGVTIGAITVNDYALYVPSDMVGTLIVDNYGTLLGAGGSGGVGGVFRTVNSYGPGTHTKYILSDDLDVVVEIAGSSGGYANGDGGYRGGNGGNGRYGSFTFNQYLARTMTIVVASAGSTVRTAGTGLSNGGTGGAQGFSSGDGAGGGATSGFSDSVAGTWVCVAGGGGGGGGGSNKINPDGRIDGGGAGDWVNGINSILGGGNGESAPADGGGGGAGGAGANYAGSGGTYGRDQYYYRMYKTSTGYTTGGRQSTGGGGGGSAYNSNYIRLLSTSSNRGNGYCNIKMNVFDNFAKNGGNVIYAGSAINFNNQGQILAGGGGGGAGRSGIGGQGGNGGHGRGYNYSGDLSGQSGFAGGNPGRSGGDWGSAGTNGDGSSTAGLAGYYIVNNSNVNWINTGTRLGRVG